MADYELFTRDTKSIIYGLQTNAIQRMLDFDYVCRREIPSVAAVVNPGRRGLHKAFFGTREILIPIYPNLKKQHQTILMQMYSLTLHPSAPHIQRRWRHLI